MFEFRVAENPDAPYLIIEAWNGEHHMANICPTKTGIRVASVPVIDMEGIVEIHRDEPPSIPAILIHLSRPNLCAP